MHMKIRSTLAVSMLTTFLAAGPASAHETELHADAAVADQRAEAASAAVQQTAPGGLRYSRQPPRREVRSPSGSVLNIGPTRRCRNW